VAPVAFSSSLRFLQGLNGSEAETPRALVSSSPESTVYKVLDGIPELESMFEVVVSAEDVYRGRPDPEGYLYAAQRLDRPPFRCVVVGNSNASVEAAHEVGMKCVVVAGSRPLYEMGAADLVVRSLDEVSFINLKKLFDLEQADAVPQSDIEEDDMY
jgi:beta-phosphoglucomutase-like phosphatase (HAD superfamily)